MKRTTAPPATMARKPAVIVPDHRWYIYNRALAAISAARYRGLSHVAVVPGDPGDWLGFRFLPCPAGSGAWQDPGGGQRQAAEALTIHAEQAGWFQVQS